MKAREKVTLQEFTMDTGLDPESIRQACGRAAEAGTQFLQSTVHEAGAVDSVIGYVITGPGGFVEQMELAVGWEEIAEERRRVTLEVGGFIIEQIKIYYIPVGSKSPVAMGSLKRFSARLRKELS